MRCYVCCCLCCAFWLFGVSVEIVVCFVLFGLLFNALLCVVWLGFVVVNFVFFFCWLVVACFVYGLNCVCCLC